MDKQGDVHKQTRGRTQYLNPSHPLQNTVEGIYCVAHQVTQEPVHTSHTPAITAVTPRSTGNTQHQKRRATNRSRNEHSTIPPSRRQVCYPFTTTPPLYLLQLHWNGKKHRRQLRAYGAPQKRIMTSNRIIQTTR